MCGRATRVGQEALWTSAPSLLHRFLRHGCCDRLTPRKREVFEGFCVGILQMGSCLLSGGSNSRSVLDPPYGNRSSGVTVLATCSVSLWWYSIPFLCLLPKRRAYCTFSSPPSAAQVHFSLHLLGLSVDVISDSASSTDMNRFHICNEAPSTK